MKSPQNRKYDNESTHRFHATNIEGTQHLTIFFKIRNAGNKRWDAHVL